VKTQRISFVAPCKVILEEIELPSLGSKQILLKSICSAISPGSERLIYRGQFPQDQPIDLNFLDQNEKFGFPMTYGYSLVGEIIAVGSTLSSAYIGKKAFAFKPHQTHVVCLLEELFLLPADFDPFHACFLANFETATNLVLDSRPLLGERVAIIGQGVLGLLTHQIMQEFPLDKLLVIDTNTYRLEIARSQSEATALLPIELEDYYHSCDLIVELSGQLQSLEQAIQLCRYEGRIISGSWYGEGPQLLALNTHFHRMRIQIQSSQVSTISPELRGRYDSHRRLALAFKLLKNKSTVNFITHRFLFTEDKVREAYQHLDKPGKMQLQMVFVYDRANL